MALVDTHAHLFAESFAHDLAAVLQRARDVGVHTIMVPGTNLENSRAAIDLATNEASWLWAAAGVHPNDAEGLDQPALDQLARMAGAPGVSAIGEIGLDYYHGLGSADSQKAMLKAQLQLAARLRMPVILHNRMADEDMVALLSAWEAEVLPQPLNPKEPLGVLHAFQGGPALGSRFVELGFYLGIGGTLTYKNSRELQTAVRELPLDALVIETDAPYLPPSRHRGERNEPAFAMPVAQKVAELRSIPLELVLDKTEENANRLFRWGSASR